MSSEGACPVAGHNLGLDRADTPFRFSQGPGEQSWQVLGTLPDSLERGSLASPSEPVLVRIPTGRLGVTVDEWFWVAHLEHLHQIRSGHTPSAAFLFLKREVTDPCL